MNATPHVAQNTNGRSSAIDGRTTRHAGYAVSQRIRETDRGSFRLDGRRSAGRSRPSSADATASVGTSPSRLRPYNLTRLPKLLATRHERAGELQTYRPMADRWSRHLGSRLSRPLRTRDDHDHRPWPRRNRPSAHSRPASTSRYSRSSVGFTWEGFDEMDEASGDGSAELNDDGSIEIEFCRITTATKPSSKPNAILLQQPARHYNDRESNSRISLPVRGRPATILEARKIGSRAEPELEEQTSRHDGAAPVQNTWRAHLSSDPAPPRGTSRGANRSAGPANDPLDRSLKVGCGRYGPGDELQHRSTSGHVRSTRRRVEHGLRSDILTASNPDGQEPLRENRTQAPHLGGQIRPVQHRPESRRTAKITPPMRGRPTDM